MTDITDDVIEDAIAAELCTKEDDLYPRQWNELSKFAELQRQRERQTVAVPDGYFYEEISGSKGIFLGPIHDNTKWHVEHNDLKLTPFWLSAATPADTVKQEAVTGMALQMAWEQETYKRSDAMRKAGEELLAAYTEPFPMGSEGQEAQDAWGLRQKNAVEAMRQVLNNNGDCPQPIVEELTNE
jgi:hypothetical protein